MDGGGEKKGIAGIVVGMVGIEGKVVGRVVGKVGNVGVFGKVGIWVLGNGGNVVGFGRVGIVGSVGKGVFGSGGNVAVGSVGIAGNGGNVTLGSVGIVGSVGPIDGAAWSNWRAARLILMLESDRAMIRESTKLCLKVAIV